MESASDMLKGLLRASVELDRDVVLTGVATALKHELPLQLVVSLRCGDEQTLILERIWTDAGLEPGNGQSISLTDEQFESFSAWHCAGSVLLVPTLSAAVFLAGLKELFLARTGGTDVSILLVPLPPEGAQRRCIVLAAAGAHVYNDTHHALCRSVCHALSLSERLIREYERLTRTQARCEHERTILRRTFAGHPEMDGMHTDLKEVMALSKQLAKISQPVLLLGELGVGKSRVARLIHEESMRAEKLLICVDCAAIEAPACSDGEPSEGIEDLKNKILAAHGGSIFLANVCALPAQAQRVVLDLLCTRCVEIKGQHHKLDVRLLASCRSPLDALVSAGVFSAKLFQRLTVFVLTVPPLRDRRKNMPELLSAVLKDKVRTLHLRTVPAIRPKDVQLLTEQAWPGNVLELENVLMQALLQWYQLGQPDAPLDFSFFKSYCQIR